MLLRVRGISDAKKRGRIGKVRIRCPFGLFRQRRPPSPTSPLLAVSGALPTVPDCLAVEKLLEGPLGESKQVQPARLIAKVADTPFSLFDGFVPMVESVRGPVGKHLFMLVYILEKELFLVMSRDGINLRLSIVQRMSLTAHQKPRTFRFG